MRLASLLIASLLLGFATPCTRAESISAEGLEFFEKHIRPVLAQECLECHSSTGKIKGGLALDSRAGWEKGGDSGAVIIVGDPQKSLLLQSIRHTDPDLKMPSKGAKLDDATIRHFEQWVQMGAPDPRDQPSTRAEVDSDRAWPAVLARRKSWWSLQPLHPSEPPLPASSWSAQPVDRFLQASMAAHGLSPAADADPATILRRLSYILTGLAPTSTLR